MTWLLAAVQMFYLNPLAPLPDVAAVMKTGRVAGRQNTMQSGAGVLPWCICGEGLARDTGRLQKLPSGLVAVPEDDL